MFTSAFLSHIGAMIRRHPVRSLSLLISTSAAVALACDLRVAAAADGHVYTSTDAIPEAPVALLLGTAKVYRGHDNGFYTTRIHAAADFIDRSPRYVGRTEYISLRSR
jgi:vancomycin permeability regulator SanA